MEGLSGLLGNDILFFILLSRCKIRHFEYDIVIMRSISRGETSHFGFKLHVPRNFERSNLYCIRNFETCLAGLSRGVHPSEAMMHYPLFQIFPLFPKNLSDSAENFPQFYLFQKNSRFHAPKFLATFLVIHQKFRISPVSLFQFIFLLFREICLFPPTSATFPS